jgi:uncharacterized protein YidB (DUF937 family)
MATDEMKPNTTTEFSRVTGEFLCDLFTVFPELQDTADSRVVQFLEAIADGETADGETADGETADGETVEPNPGPYDDCDVSVDGRVTAMKEHCVAVFPERFFDILYKNEDMFSADTEVNTEFLPGINFGYLWNIPDVTDATKTIMWNYLQLILFTIVEDVKDGSGFGDTAKLFEAIDETELKTKLEETMNQMKDAFAGTDTGSDEGDAGATSIPLPNAEDIHGHLRGMLGGKIGSLAQEIAEETALDLDIDTENADDIQGVFQKLFKNPGKLMGLVKNVGTKLDTKIKSGDLKESELIEEATEIMGKMKDMPGMGNIQDILKKMGMGDMMGAMGGGDKNTRPVSAKSVEAQLATQLKMAKDKERRIAEMERRRDQKEADRHIGVMAAAAAKPDLTPEEMDALVFSVGETVERSTKADRPPAAKKKKKKKKN